MLFILWLYKWFYLTFFCLGHIQREKYFIGFSVQCLIYCFYTIVEPFWALMALV